MDAKVDESFIVTVLSEINRKNILDKHKLFENIEELEPRKLADILIPFYFAVKFWTEHLEVFREKLISCNDLLSANLVQENIDDEKGSENGKMIYSKKHVVTYINFLLSLDPAIILRKHDAVDKFIAGLESSLENSPLAFHACILGAIEHFYIQISTVIKNYCDKYGIRQEHYTTHEILDQKHAMDFFNVAINQGVKREQLFRGIHAGYQLLWDVYENLV